MERCAFFGGKTPCMCQHVAFDGVSAADVELDWWGAARALFGGSQMRASGCSVHPGVSPRPKPAHRRIFRWERTAAPRCPLCNQSLERACLETAQLVLTAGGSAAAVLLVAEQRVLSCKEIVVATPPQCHSQFFLNQPVSFKWLQQKTPIACGLF